MLKVLYDHQIFQLQKFGGISRYFYELVKVAKESGDGLFDISLLHSYNDYIKDRRITNHFDCLENMNFKGKERMRSFFNEWNSLSRLSKYDIFHPTFFNDYYLSSTTKKSCKTVVTVYDMINEKFPHYFKGDDLVPKMKERMIREADKVLAISESTKNDLINIYKISPDKIDVTYLASSLGEIRSREIINLPKRYILFIGKRDTYKNFERMYFAIKKILLNEEISLVCGGGGSFSKQEKDTFKEDLVEDKVTYIDISDNRVLKKLYECAMVFIFPSLYEGFGIPVLEAMSAGCSVALSNASSFPEVAGELGLYFDPESESSISATVLRAIDAYENGNVKRSELISCASHFTWKKTYMDTLLSYKSMF